MPPVGCPEASVFAANDDQWIEKSPGLIDASREALYMGRRQVALEGRGLHRAERHTGNEQSAPAERVVIGADGYAAAAAHQLPERDELGIVQRRGDLRRAQPTRLLGASELAAT